MGSQDVACGEAFGVCGAAKAVGGSGEIVTGVPELNIGIKEEPIRTGFREWHANAACVPNLSRADHSLKLNVGVGPR